MVLVDVLRQVTHERLRQPQHRSEPLAHEPVLARVHPAAFDASQAHERVGVLEHAGWLVERLRRRMKRVARERRVPGGALAKKVEQPPGSVALRVRDEQETQDALPPGLGRV